MLGMLCWQEQGRLRVERTRVAGLGVLCAYITPGGHREQRQLTRAVKLLRRAGVRQILPNRVYRPEVSMPSVAPLPLYRALAHRLVLLTLEGRGESPQQATVVLHGAYPDSDLAGTAYRLCPLVRQVIIDTQWGGEALQRRLYRQFGVTVGAVAVGRPVLQVYFDNPSQENGLNLCGQRGAAGFCLDAPGIELPEYLDRDAALCALWQRGALSPEQLCVRRAEGGNKFT